MGVALSRPSQFIHNRYTNDFTLSRVLPWVLGKEVLKDDRCVWAQLSTPLNGTTAMDALSNFRISLGC